MSKHSIFIIDDHPVLREGVAFMIDNESDLSVCGDAAGAGEALYLLSQTHPDLALLDLSLKDGNGLTMLKPLRELRPDLKILILSAHDEDQYAAEAIRQGAMGYIMKDENRSELLRAMRQVLRGEIYLSSRIVPRVMTNIVRGDEPAAFAVEKALSQREFEIFRMIGRGFETGRIADQLKLSPKTVRVHRDNIRRKLKVRNAHELLQMALDWHREQL